MVPGDPSRHWQHHGMISGSVRLAARGRMKERYATIGRDSTIRFWAAKARALLRCLRAAASRQGRDEVTACFAPCQVLLWAHLLVLRRQDGGLVRKVLSHHASRGIKQGQETSSAETFCSTLVGAAQMGAQNHVLSARGWCAFTCCFL